MPRRIGSRGSRLRALVRRQFIQIVRDRRSLVLIFTVPVLELFLFAYAIDLTADHLPTAVVDLSLDAQSRAFIEALSVSGYFDVEFYMASEAEVIRAIDKGAVQAGVVIPPGFAQQIGRGEAQALIILDGSESFSVRAGYSAATAIAHAYSLDLVAEQVNRLGGTLETSPIRATARVLYNPNMDDLIFILPGLVALLMQALAVGTTAQSIVREYELGTMEQLLITPVRPIELVVGKLLPNVALVFVVLLVTTGGGVLWFGVPFQGDPILFVWLSLLFVVSGLGLGMLISAVAQTQKQARQLSATLMLLSQMLTGFIYPREPMPAAVKMLGNLIPVTYFIRIARGIVTKGVALSFVWSDVVALLVYGSIVVVISAIGFKKRLD